MVNSIFHCKKYFWKCVVLIYIYIYIYIFFFGGWHIYKITIAKRTFLEIFCCHIVTFDVSQAGYSNNRKPWVFLGLMKKSLLSQLIFNFFKVCRHLRIMYLVKHILEQFTFSSCDLLSPSSIHYPKRKNQNIFRLKEKKLFWCN